MVPACHVDLRSVADCDTWLDVQQTLADRFLRSSSAAPPFLDAGALFVMPDEAAVTVALHIGRLDLAQISTALQSQLTAQLVLRDQFVCQTALLQTCIRDQAQPSVRDGPLDRPRSKAEPLQLPHGGTVEDWRQE